MNLLGIISAIIICLPPTTAQDACSCSPTTYNFQLNFAGTCFPFTGSDNDGIDGSLCFFTQGGDPNDIDEENIDFGGPVGKGSKGAASSSEEGKQQQQHWKRILSNMDFAMHIRHAEEMIASEQQQTPQPQQLRRMRTINTTPTIITSVTFLEAGATSQLTIINQDSTYFDTPLSDGDILSYTSISDGLDTSLPIADQMDLVPGGVMLVLFGINANDEVVQNTVAWGYASDDCDVEPLAVGDGVGWVTLEEFSPAKAAFCAAVSLPKFLTPPAPTEEPPATTTEATEMHDTTTTEMPPPPVTTTEMHDTTTTEMPPPPVTTTEMPPPATTTETTLSSKGSKSHGAFAKSAKMAKNEGEIDTEDQKMSSKSHKKMSSKNSKVAESSVKSPGIEYYNLIMEEDASMSMNLSFSFNLMEDESMSYKASVPGTHVEKSPFGRRNGLRSHEE